MYIQTKLGHLTYILMRGLSSIRDSYWAKSIQVASLLQGLHTQRQSGSHSHHHQLT